MSKQAKLLRKREAFIYMHMIRKGQMQVKKDTQPSAAGQFYSLMMYVVLTISIRLVRPPLSRQNHPSVAARQAAKARESSAVGETD